MNRTVTVDSRIKLRPPELLELPHIVRVTKFDEAGVKAFGEDLDKALQTGQEEVPVFIDSYGGSAYGLLEMVSRLEACPLPIVTVVEGKAMSAGAILFACGRDRWAGPYSTFMLHEVASLSMGKVEEIKADTKETERLNTLFFALLAKKTGQPDTYFTDLIHKKGHADWYLTAKEAKKHLLATVIGVPSYHTTVSVTHTLKGG